MLGIEVCVGSACHLKGSYDVIHTLQDLINENNLDDKVEVKAAFCLGHCADAVSVKFDDGDTIYSLESNKVSSFFNTEVRTRID